MRCEDVRPLISAGLDGELDESRAAQVRGHLVGCALCTAEREALSATVRLLRALPEEEPPAHLRRQIGVALLDTQRRSERRWLGLSLVLARPRSAGWAWGAALGAVAATVGLVATRPPAPPQTAGAVSSPAPSAVPSAPPAPKLAGQSHPNPLLPKSRRSQPASSSTTAAAPVPQATPAAAASDPVRTQPLALPGSPPPTTKVAELPQRQAHPRQASPHRNSPPAAVPPKTGGSAPPRGASSPDRADNSARDVASSAHAGPPPPMPDPDLTPDDERPDTSAMTQMASSDPPPTAPANSADDLVELRRRLIDRPLQVPQLGELKPSDTHRSSRDGWIRF